jgi:surfeit locus 1 family protein
VTLRQAQGRRGRIPIVSTIVVLAAVAIMVSLGVWQLHRKTWKEGLIARYAAAEKSDIAVAWPVSPAEYKGALYRRSQFFCAQVTGMEAISGRSAEDQPGWAHIARCRTPQGTAADVALGWSNDPANPRWRGGEVAGWVASSRDGVRLVAWPAQAGLAQLARPDPSELSGTTPMGHLSYAFQWFAFALTALVIYVLAIRKKWRAGG